jgi:hypothetical protein
MNKKAQSLGLGIITGLFILIVGLMVVNFLMPEITNFRVDMNCANPSEISDGTKLVCLMSDATIPYWIILVFSLLVGVIASRFK